jgi:hypothetical protein
MYICLESAQSYHGFDKARLYKGCDAFLAVTLLMDKRQNREFADR